MVDARPGFLGSRCENLDRDFEWPGAVDESGQNDTWTDRRYFFSSIRRHTRFDCDWSSDVCSSDLLPARQSERPPAPLCSTVPRKSEYWSGLRAWSNRLPVKRAKARSTRWSTPRRSKLQKIGRASCRERV